MSLHLVLICELSLSAKFHVCISLPSGRFWWGLLVTCYLLVTCDRGKTKSTPSPTDLDCTVRLDWSLTKKSMRIPSEGQSPPPNPFGL